MRTRDEIQGEIEWKMYKNGELETQGGTPVGELCLEVLLDIRTLLTHKE